MLFEFILRLVNSPNYNLGIIQEASDMSIPIDEQTLYSIYYDAEELWFALQEETNYHLELFGIEL